MNQVTVQDYRDAFINDHLPLTTVSIHRSVTQTFVKQAKEYRLDLTARNCFDYFMFNACADKRKLGHNFGETSSITNKQIADYIGKKESSIRNAIGKLVKSGLVERHAVKKDVFIIPSMIKAQQELSDQSVMKRQMKITEKAEAKIAEISEAMDRELYPNERRRIYAEIEANYNKSHSSGNGNGNGQSDLPFG